MKHAVIITAVVDLRKEPRDLLPRNFSHHPMRDSQLLYGEQVRVLEESQQWLQVEALEQERFTNENGWHPYPGWIHSSEVAFVDTIPPPNCVVCVPWLKVDFLPFPLSFGTYLRQTSPGHLLLPTGESTTCDPLAVRSFPDAYSRELLLNDAELFLGAPYLWGGRASFGEGRVSSVDCSGLINLLHRAQGLLIPRDAHDQYLKSRKLQPDEIQFGDLVYLSREGKPERITHVVLYTGDSTFLEAPETGKYVRSLSFLSPLNERVHLEERTHPYNAHYSSFFPA